MTRLTYMDWIVVWLLNELVGLLGLIAFVKYVVPVVLLAYWRFAR